VLKQLPSKCKVQGCEFTLQYHKKKKNCHRPHTFHDFIISLGHLRSCGSSLLSVQSWVSTMFKYCSTEETPHKALPKSLNHYAFFFLLFFVCLFFHGLGFELRALYLPDKHTNTWTQIQIFKGRLFEDFDWVLWLFGFIAATVFLSLPLMNL
jgi:hypothetical protein